MHNKHDTIDERERRILHGLRAEWELGLWDLPFHLRDRFRPPLFRLMDSRNIWGSWSAERREISISRTLVENHGWDDVREVLLHEMAHQLAEECLYGKGEEPHGLNFREACRLLGANPRASGSAATLRQRVARDPADEDPRVRRVRKLFALASSGNRHEAELAMTKAHRLMAEMENGALEAGEARTYETIFLGPARLRQPREAVHLANLLQKFYFVSGVWVPVYVFERGKVGSVLEISGTARNLRVAEYVYDYVVRYVDRQWAEYAKGKKLGRRRKTDFALGLIAGFREKLVGYGENGAEEPGGSGALVGIRDGELDRYVRGRYRRLRTVRRRAVRRDREVVSAGKEAGRKLVIHEGIEERGAKGLFIE